MAPVARVESRKGRRKGRGFSEAEIKEAGLTIAMARKLKVAVDTRRKSAHDFNIEELKKLKVPEKKRKAKKAVKAPKAEKKPKAAKKPAAKAKAKPAKAAPKKAVKKPAKKKPAPKKK